MEGEFLLEDESCRAVDRKSMETEQAPSGDQKRLADSIRDVVRDQLVVDHASVACRCVVAAE